MLLNETKEWGPQSNLNATSSSDVDLYDIAATGAMHPAVFADDFGEDVIL